MRRSDPIIVRGFLPLKNKWINHHVTTQRVLALIISLVSHPVPLPVWLPTWGTIDAWIPGTERD
jgi:hypothetical protein